MKFSTALAWTMLAWIVGMVLAVGGTVLFPQMGFMGGVVLGASLAGGVPMVVWSLLWNPYKHQ